MRLTFSIDSEEKMSFLEAKEGGITFLVLRGGKEQQVLLRNEPILLCGGEGIFFVSDGYELFCVRDGFAKCIYKAAYKIYELTDVAGKALLVDENILTHIDGNGELLWQYWHIEPINKIVVRWDYIEIIDENKSLFRVSINDGKLV